MIPPQDQQLLRTRFGQALRNRIRIDLFTQRPSPIIIPGRPECPYCEDVQTLVQELSFLTDKISPNLHDFYAEPKAAADLGVDRIPAIVLRGKSNRPMRYFGMPTGAEFPSLVETLIETSSDDSPLQLSTIKDLRKIRDNIKLQVFVTPSCIHSPAVARTAFRLAQQSNKIKTDVIEINEFPDLLERYDVRATPTTVINETLVLTGAMDEATLVDCLLKVVEHKAIAQSSIKTGACTLIPQVQTLEARMAGSGLIIPR